jgi:hypothetical protein
MQGIAGKTVMVVGSSSPARNAALELALRDCVERHGWGERVGIAGGGLGAGAGSVAVGDGSLLADAGLGTPLSAFPDLDLDRTLLGAAATVVAEDEATARRLVGYRELGRADLIRVDEVFPELAPSTERSLAEDLSAFVDAAPELLRRVIAGPPED